MSLRTRHIAELFLRIVIRQTNHGHLGQVSSEALPARRNVLLYSLQSRPLRPWTPGRRIVQSALPHLFLRPMLADPLAILDPLPPLPWMLLPYDDIAIQITALVLSTLPNHLSTATLCCQFCLILTLQSCMSQHQPGIVISLPSSASMGRQQRLWST